METLARIAQEVSGCTACGLCSTRKNAVPGEGNPSPRILLVGEGPGEKEDLEGRPFVGRAGELLDEALRQAFLARDEIFIANVVKCRPPGNRNPTLAEMQACSGFLFRQIEATRPRLVVTLGKVASEFLLQKPVRITKENRHLHFPPFAEALMTVYHPAYVLRNRTREVETAFFAAFQDARTIAYGQLDR